MGMSGQNTKTAAPPSLAALCAAEKRAGEKTVAVVTGASGGLGAEFVRLLALDPALDEIWAIARSADKLRAIARECGGKVVPVPMDVSDGAAIRAFGASVPAGVRIVVLVNNAGFAKFGSWEDIPDEEARNMIDLNVGGVVSMANACIPHMPRGAHMLNIASQAAFQPLPYQNLYSSTKAFVRNYSRALNVELRGRGIAVTAVCPGWIRTDLYGRAATGAEKATTRFCHMAQPRDVASKALKDASRGKDMSVYGVYVKFCHLLAKILPQRVMMKLWLRQQDLN